MGKSGPLCWHTESLVRPGDDPVCRAAQDAVLHNDASIVGRLSVATAGDAVQGEEVAVSSQHCVSLRTVAILGDQLRLKQDKRACGQSRPQDPASDLLSYRLSREDVCVPWTPAVCFFLFPGRSREISFPKGDT